MSGGKETTLRLLHISDAHFGTIPATPPRRGRPRQPERSAHYFADGSRSIPGELANVLVDDFATWPPDLVDISGDIGWSGTAEDYEPALRFLESLRGAWPDAHFVIAPGNHDVDRQAATAGKEPQAAFLAMLHRFYAPDDFARMYPLLDGEDPLAPRHKLVAFDYVQDQHLVVAVNSAASLTTCGTPIFVDPRVLRLIRRQVGSLAVSPKTLRMFVLHHHLFPFAEPNWTATASVSAVPDKPDETIVANSAKLQAWLAENRFLLVLHGHKHLAHGRYDVLWRRGGPSEGRKLLVLGAGSAGVAADQRSHGEPPTFNVIDIQRLAEQRWHVQVETRRIDDNQGEYSASRDNSYAHEVGRAAAGAPVVYAAQTMDVCHGAIAAELMGTGQIVRSFVSVVEDPTYFHPPTLRIGTRHPLLEEVESSFRALHPEWEPRTQWDRAGHVDTVLSNLPVRFQFQHGPRLFGVLGRSGRQLRGVTNRRPLQPIWRAVESLGSSSPSRAYVGLYNAEIDVATDQEPLPGLMSIQFVPDGNALDAVVTFRKVELSFWWAVNMYEVGELLRWAAKHDPNKRKPRRITFFAALAEWKEQPEATFVTELDSIPLARLCQLVMEADVNTANARAELARLLEDKIDRTNEANIDHTGLSRLVEIIKGRVQAQGEHDEARQASPISRQLLDSLAEAAALTEEAERGSEDRGASIERAKEHLQAALRHLEGP